MVLGNVHQFVMPSLTRSVCSPIADCMAASIEDVGYKKVAAVVTDNAANMKQAKALLKDKFPHLIIFR